MSTGKETELHLSASSHRSREQVQVRDRVQLKFAKRTLEKGGTPSRHAAPKAEMAERKRPLFPFGEIFGKEIWIVDTNDVRKTSVSGKFQLLKIDIY